MVKARISPSVRYRRSAWLASMGLIFFFAAYLGLAGWFSYVTYRFLRSVFVGMEGAFLSGMAAIPSAFVAVFLWKALFVSRRTPPSGLEVFREDQPELFQLADEIADEVGAPRVHRVFITPEVTAFVSYEASLINLIIPTKKNLTIGLGLVNNLNRIELKAVLAHEFGHFAQQSMEVGLWAARGHAIAANIVYHRDRYDKFVKALSYHDLRIAWFGWVLQFVMWSIRSVMDTGFQWVIRGQRSLSREMEYHADQVAVACTGSDALVHALYRLQAADQDWELSLAFADRMFRQKSILEDIYAVQTAIASHLRRILAKPERGLSPKATSDEIFEAGWAQPGLCDK